MRKFMLPGALAVLGVLSCLSADRAIAQQETAKLAEKLEVGTVRMVDAHRSLEATTIYYPDTDYSSSSKTAIERAFRADEWVTAMDGARVSEVVRSYGNYQSSTTTGEGANKLTVPGWDPKQHKTFVLKVKSDGTRTVTEESAELATADDVSYVQLDTDADLLPGREAKVGDSWKLPAGKLGRAGMTTQVDTIESSDVTVKFSSVSKDANGDSIANLAVSGGFSVKSFYNSGYGDKPETDFKTDATLSGSALFNITRGRMVHYEWKGEGTGKGRLNGGDVKVVATFAESNDYGYAAIYDKAAENGSEGPDKPTSILSFKHGAVDPGHILIARNNGTVSRIQVFDPASRKIVKTLLAMPGNNTITTMSLSPDRKHVAFSSNMNSGISIANADVFVLDLETAKINQISPGWAANDGICKPLDTGKTCTITGRIVWYDDDPQYRRDRSDGFTGSAHVDHTACEVVVGADGRFKLTGVPAGTSILLKVSGRLPNYSNGKARTGNDAWAGMVTVEMVLDEGGKDLGDCRVHGNWVDSSFDRPCWVGDSIWVNESGYTRGYRVGQKTHSWDMVDFGELRVLYGGFSVSRDGKYAAFCNDTSGQEANIGLFDLKGKAISNFKVPGATLSYRAEGAWTPDGNWACTAGIENQMGKNYWGAPALAVVQPQQNVAGLYRAWPQLYGHTMMSLGVDEKANVGYFVTHKYVPDKQATYGDAWAWDSGTDTLARLTSLGDVICVASYGR